MGGVGGKGVVDGVHGGRVGNDVDVGGGGGIPEGLQKGRWVVIAYSASGHGTQVLFGANHVDDEEVCESDPAGKEELCSRQSRTGRSDPGTP